MRHPPLPNLGQDCQREEPVRSGASLFPCPSQLCRIQVAVQQPQPSTGVGVAIVQLLEKKVMEEVVAGGVKLLVAKMVTTGLLHHVARRVIEVVTDAAGDTVRLLLVVMQPLILMVRWLLSRI